MIVNLSPAVFPLDQRTPLTCASTACTKQIMFCEAIVWNWHDGTKSMNAGFCSNACALDSMATEGMPRA